MSVLKVLRGDPSIKQRGEFLYSVMKVGRNYFLYRSEAASYLKSLFDWQVVEGMFSEMSNCLCSIHLFRTNSKGSGEVPSTEGAFLPWYFQLVGVIGSQAAAPVDSSEDNCTCHNR